MLSSGKPYANYISESFENPEVNQSIRVSLSQATSGYPSHRMKIFELWWACDSKCLLRDAVWSNLQKGYLWDRQFASCYQRYPEKWAGPCGSRQSLTRKNKSSTSPTSSTSSNISGVFSRCVLLFLVDVWNMDMLLASAAKLGSAKRYLPSLAVDGTSRRGCHDKHFRMTLESLCVPWSKHG